MVGVVKHMRLKLGPTGVALALVASAFGGMLSVPSVAATPSCGDTPGPNGGMNCDLDCLKGDTVAVAGSGNDDDFHVNASCQGSYAGCSYTPELAVLPAPGRYECADPVANQEAISSGDGDCYGNAGGPGAGSISCVSRSGGEDAVLELVRELLEDSMAPRATCEELIPGLLAVGATSLFVGELHASGAPTPIIVWHADSGCIETTQPNASADGGPTKDVTGAVREFLGL